MFSYGFILLFLILVVNVVIFLIYQYNQAKKYKRKKHSLAVKEKTNTLRSSRPRNEADTFPFTSYINPPQYHGPHGYRSLPPEYAGRLDYSTIGAQTPQPPRQRRSVRNRRSEHQEHQDQYSRTRQTSQSRNQISNKNTQHKQSTRNNTYHATNIPQQRLSRENTAPQNSQPIQPQYDANRNTEDPRTRYYIEQNRNQVMEPNPLHENSEPLSSYQYPVQGDFVTNGQIQSTPSKPLKTQSSNPEAPKSILRNNKKRHIPQDIPSEENTPKKVFIQDPDQKKSLKSNSKQLKRKNAQVIDTRLRKKQKTSKEKNPKNQQSSTDENSSKRKSSGFKRPLARIGSDSSVFSHVKRRRINNNDQNDNLENDSLSNPSTPRANRIAYKINEMKHDDRDSETDPSMFDSIQASPIPNTPKRNLSPGLNTPAKMSPIASKISELWSSIFSPTPQKKRKMRKGRSGFALRKGLRPDQRVLTNTHDIKAHQDRANAVINFAEREHAKKIEEEKLENTKQKPKDNPVNNLPDHEKSEKKVRFQENNNTQSQNNRNSQSGGFSLGSHQSSQQKDSSTSSKASTGGFSFGKVNHTKSEPEDNNNSKGFGFAKQKEQINNKPPNTGGFAVPSNKTGLSAPQQSGDHNNKSTGFKFDQKESNPPTQTQFSSQSTATTKTTNNTGFKFGSQTQSSTASFKFNQQSQQKQSQEQQQQQQKTSSSTGGFNIGKSQEQPTSTPQPSTQSGFSFPKGKTDTQNPAPQSSQKGGFGSQTQSSAQPSAGFGFSGFNKPSSSSSSNQSSQPLSQTKSNHFGFGKPSSNGSQTPSGFGSNSGPTNNTGGGGNGGFGKPKNSSAGFGLNPTGTSSSLSQPNKFEGFGKQQNGGFGSMSQQPTSNHNNNNNNPSQSGSNGFSAKSTIAAGGFGVTQQNSGFGNTFGNSNSTAPSKSSFGSSQPSSGFNKPHSNASQGFGFGSTPQTNSQSGGLNPATESNKQSAAFSGIYTPPARGGGFKKQAPSKNSFGFGNQSQSQSQQPQQTAGFGSGGSGSGFGAPTTNFGSKQNNGNSFGNPSGGGGGGTPNSSFSQGGPKRVVRGTPRRKRRGRK